MKILIFQDLISTSASNPKMGLKGPSKKEIEELATKYYNNSKFVSANREKFEKEFQILTKNKSTKYYSAKKEDIEKVKEDEKEKALVVYNNFLLWREVGSKIHSNWHPKGWVFNVGFGYNPKGSITKKQIDAYAKKNKMGKYASKEAKARAKILSTDFDHYSQEEEFFDVFNKRAKVKSTKIKEFKNILDSDTSVILAGKEILAEFNLAGGDALMRSSHPAKYWIFRYNDKLHSLMDNPHGDGVEAFDLGITTNAELKAAFNAADKAADKVTSDGDD